MTRTDNCLVQGSPNYGLRGKSSPRSHSLS